MTATAKSSITADVSGLVEQTPADASDVLNPVVDLLTHLKSGRLSVTAADTHGKHLDDALVVGGGLVKAVLNPGANEQMQLTLDSSVVTTTGAQTLSNKTLTAPVIGDFTNAVHNHQNAAGGGQLNASSAFSSGTVPDARLPADLVRLTGAQTLASKTLTSPIIGDFTNAGHSHLNAAGGGTLSGSAIGSGTVADARLSSNVVLLTGAQTLASKTLTSPTIGDFTNAGHSHQNAAGGGTLNASSVFGSGTVPVARLPGMVGDSGAGGTAGLVPAPAMGDATKYLRGDGTYAAPSGSGTVTSVGLTMPAEFSVGGTPVTASGTLAVTKANQSANRVYAGPVSGGAAAPAFRALVAADIAGLDPRVKVSVQTTNATPLLAWSMVCPINTRIGIDGVVFANRANFSNNRVMARFVATAARGAGSITAADSGFTNVAETDTGAPTVTIDSDGTDTVRIYVTGTAAVTMDWVILLTVTQY